MQLILEQHVFDLCGSTYTRIFFFNQTLLKIQYLWDAKLSYSEGRLLEYDVGFEFVWIWLYEGILEPVPARYAEG